jgi:hypothetical protein
MFDPRGKLPTNISDEANHYSARIAVLFRRAAPVNEHKTIDMSALQDRLRRLNAARR